MVSKWVYNGKDQEGCLDQDEEVELNTCLLSSELQNRNLTFQSMNAAKCFIYDVSNFSSRCFPQTKIKR